MVNSAHAQVAGASAEGFNFVSFLPIVLIFVVMYFLLIRPQQKRTKQHQEMLKTLKKGDKILTSGGIIAIITRTINDQELEVEISPGTQVRLMRSMIANVLSRTGSSHVAETSNSSDGSEKSSKEKNRKAQELMTNSKSKKK